MKVWNFIVTKMLEEVDVVLLYVLESKGSSPGRQGFKMAVSSDGDFYGSIGGGIMEHKFVELAKAELGKNAAPIGVHKQVHNKTSPLNQSGMICSGEQTIFLYKLHSLDLPQIRSLLRALRAGRNGSLHLSPAGILFREEVPPFNFKFQQISDQEFVLVEKAGFKNQLHIIGGGHCALALSKLMSSMDFQITVYDERPGLSTMEQNVFAHQQVVVNNYLELEGIIPEGENVYVVIMTFGYRTDDQALSAVQNKKFKYLGMMGSANKVSKLLESYNGSATTLHSPIGISIRSQTPEEIAVSVAAQIIQVKNQ